MTKISDIPQLEASVEEKGKFARDWTEMIEFISSRQLDSDWVDARYAYRIISGIGAKIKLCPHPTA